MNHNNIRQAFVMLICAGLVSLGMPAPAQAGMIGTAELLGQEARAAKIEQVQSFLARGEVRGQLEALGVVPELAAERVAGLTDAELQELALNLEDLPAGAGAAELVLVVLLILILLEVVGAIDIFPKI